MTRLRVMVVDDEPLAREGLADLLRTLPEVDVVGVHADGVSALHAIAARAPDVLCIDIRMPGIDGFDVVAAIDAARMPEVIFVTAYDAFAMRAFEVHAADYLLKPVTADRLEQAIERVRRRRVASDERGAERIAALLKGITTTRPTGAGRLIVREVGQLLVIPTGDVDWIEGADYYAKLYVAGKVHLMRETLTSLEQRLDPARWMRVNRSAIVNLTRVRVVEAAERGDGTVVLSTGARVRVKAERRVELESRLVALPEGR